MKTSVGLVRERNEDHAYVDPDGLFYIVADGMGGTNAGDVASETAVDVVRRALERARDAVALVGDTVVGDGRLWIQRLLENALHEANDEVYRRGQCETDKENMGTTLDVVLIAGGEAFVAHVGDSRVYLIRDGQAQVQTDDHTMAQLYRRAGTLSDEEAEVSPMRAVLANAIGVTPDVTVDHCHVVLRPGDRLLLCTDGMYEYFADQELSPPVADCAAADALDWLIAEACKRGGHDNITGMVIEVGAPAAAPQEALDDAITAPFELPVEPTAVPVA